MIQAYHVYKKYLGDQNVLNDVTININDRGTAVLVVTHDRELIARLGKRVINLERGRVLDS